MKSECGRRPLAVQKWELHRLGRHWGWCAFRPSARHLPLNIQSAAALIPRHSPIPARLYPAATALPARIREMATPAHAHLVSLGPIVRCRAVATVLVVATVVAVDTVLAMMMVAIAKVVAMVVAPSTALNALTAFHRPRLHSALATTTVR
jgi:hypothetical protein